MVIIELQGDLETKSQSASLNGKFIGDLHFTKLVFCLQYILTKITDNIFLNYYAFCFHALLCRLFSVCVFIDISELKQSELIGCLQMLMLEYSVCKMYYIL